jgi:hypothetical protein
VVLQGNFVENLYSISLGPDSTIVLLDHTQTIITKELGQYKYKIDLAYIISFGNEITPTTVYGYVEDVIAYSISSWRQKDASR